jgi:acyl-[acyl-carrier-protein]-phospholipid O-acyltransferase/long-chain-fatty-acid--[acyl-carrier-protein] ligase
MTEVAQNAADIETEEADDNTPAVKEKSWVDKQVARAVRGTLRFALKRLWGVTFNGEENFAATKGKNTLIIANHVSFVDAVMLGASLPVDAAFAIDTGMYNKITNNPIVRFTPLRFLWKRLDLHPLDMNKPMELRTLTKLAKAGKPVMIFPEGRLTTTGTMMQVFGGSASVAINADAQILPIYLDGLNFLPKKLTRLEDYPSRVFPKLSVNVLPPQQITIPDDVKGKARRSYADDQLEKIMLEMPVKAVSHNQNLMDSLHNTARNFGFKHQSVFDADEENPQPLDMGTLLTKSYFIGKKLAKITQKGENVGFLLPNGKAAPVTFFGLNAFGRVPTMLNAKAEKADMISYTETAALKTVVTSRRFVKLAKLEDKIEALAEKTKIVYLEDMKPADTLVGKLTSLPAKIEAFARAHRLLPAPKDAPKGDDPAAIIFTSGSEGPPKGVVLSAHNFLANIAQVHAITPISPKDKLFNAMPVFHSFGLVGGMIMPVLKGLRSFQFPNPLEAKKIPKLAYFFDATIMFGTDTFLDLYARNAKDKDLSRLSRGLVFAGAERLQEKTYNTWFDRFGAQILNAYGLSEAAPGVAMNVPGAHRRGTVGRFLPGIETRLEPVPDMDESFRLYIKGPNVMLGYLKHDNPGVIQAPPDGWHDTGDIVKVSDEGYVTLTGRAKRFAKIGGEMVSLDAVENLAVAASQKKDAAHAVVLKQDADNGDSIVLFTTDPLLKRDALTKAAQETGRSILGLPKNNEIYVLPELPKLPTGKTDYVTLQKQLKAGIPAAPAKAAPAVVETPNQSDFNAAADKPALANDNQQPGVKAPEAPKAAKSASGGPAL